MFTLHDIDIRILSFNSAADELEAKAERPGTDLLKTLAYRCHADGLREAAVSLERMVQDAVEREAREAMRP